jgi:plasmid stabilization system protein ParE
VKKLRLVLSEAVAADIVEQADWYEEQSGPTLAQRWETAVTSTLLRVVENPRLAHFAPSVMQNSARCGEF